MATAAVERHKCNCCHKDFAHPSGLYRHKSKEHANEISGRISCVACDQTFSNSDMYREHCMQDHRSENATFDKVTAEFPSLQQFHEWKTAEEKRTTASYKHKRTFYDKAHEPRKMYFDCNCTGKGPTEPENRKRVRRTTIKMAGRCPAYINVTFASQSLLQVEACLDHLGHDQKLGNLRIPDDLRSSLARQLSIGVSMDSILDRIRDNIDETFDRSHIVQRKDLYNIKQQFQLLRSRKDKDDYQSILVKYCFLCCSKFIYWFLRHNAFKKWIDELRRESYDPIVLFQPLEAGPQGQKNFMLGMVVCT